MTKHHWRQQIKSFFKSHADPDSDEMLKQTQRDMAEKKERIIKLIKGTGEVRDGGGESILIRSPSRNDHLQELVEDFYKQYQTLYDLYENLTGELKKKAHIKQHEDDSTSSSESESDSDDHSLKEKHGTRNGKMELQQELQTAKNEILDLKKKLIALTNGKEKAEQTIEDLIGECENWKQERSQVMAEKEAMKARLDSSVKLEAELHQRAQRLNAQNNLLMQEKENISKRAEEAETALKEVKNTVMGLKNDKESLNVELETSRQEVLDLKKNLVDATNLEISSLNDTRNTNISESSSARIKQLEDELNHLKVELDALKSKKTTAEEQLVSKTTEVASLREKITELEATIKGGENELNNVQGSLEKLSGLEKENSQLKTKTEHMETRNTDQSKEDLVVELQKTIEYLKSDIEEEREEIFSVEEKNRTLEVKLRLSNQKVRITEQLLSEKEDIHRFLEKKNAAMSEALKTYTRMVNVINTQVNKSLNEFERSILKKFEEDYKGMSRRVSVVSKEIQSVESWVRSVRIRDEEMEKIMKDGSIMKEKIERLEEEVKRGKVVMEETVRALTQVERTVEELGMKVKEKDERLMCLGEEKREAIRQLCLWVEYQRNRCEELKGVLMKTSRMMQRTN